MADICRVETDGLESAAGDLEQEKSKLAGTRAEVAGTTLPAEAFGRVDQSAQAAQGHTATVNQLTQELDAAGSEITKRTEYLRDWKNKYETESNRALQCFINLRRLRGAPLP